MPTYGFGANVLFPNHPQKGQVSHFFPCSGDMAKTAGYGVSGVFQLYSECLRNVQLNGPTYFSPMLKEVVTFTREAFLKDPNSYLVLLILTDGAIHDMRDTIDWIVEGSELPLSVIIVGIGSADFSLMDALDSDDKVATGPN